MGSGNTRSHLQRGHAMKSNATNDVGVAVENLLAAALHRLIEKKASPEEKAKIHLALRPEFASPDIEAFVMASCEALHDHAEEIASELFDAVVDPANV